ncbi:rhombotarget A [Acinetobacter sp. WZC-1]|uniref:rhombotarget A n=1 Tax=Acinetobacter sp. WZC-1 TaxID=3459034 RepID=UPI00403DEA23
MFKRGIGLGLLCITGHVYSANITVTTTADVVSADNQCSLREAIEYVNQGMPEAGYNGCGGKGANNVIELKGRTEYRLDHQIPVARSVQIKSTYDSALGDNSRAKNNAVIKMAGRDRLFLIDRSQVPFAEGESAESNQLISIVFYETTLDGCAQTSCADQGGLIYNKENLSIQYGQLLNGVARQGGAIYNAGVYEASKQLSAVSVVNSLIKGNKASQGAVIYSEIPQFVVSQSVVRDNEVTEADASLFDSRDAFDEAALKSLGSTLTRGIWNSTIFNNTGHIIKVMDGMLVNNITMILNSMGLIFNAPFSNAYVSNSILARNGAEDCKIVAGADALHISNNLYSAGCAGTDSQQLGNIPLIAGSNTEGKCDINSDGILCPFSESANTAVGYFRPRLLSSYQKLSDSLIVNHGPQKAGSNLMSCESTDQRGGKRPETSELCDIGAVELAVDRTTTSGIGADLFYGETAKMTIADQLQDGELITAEQCQALLGNSPDGQPWQPGCLRLVQTNTVSKGKTTLSQDGDVSYVPNGNWHGSDEFKILVITTTTRFNDSENRYIEIPVKIVQNPPSDFEDKKVKTSGGSGDLISLLGLMALLGFRRFKK